LFCEFLTDNVAQKYAGYLFPTITHPLQHGLFRKPSILDVLYVDNIIYNRVDNLNARYDFIASKFEAYFLRNGFNSSR
jgi:hypothetical protein